MQHVQFTSHQVGALVSSPWIWIWLLPFVCDILSLLLSFLFPLSPFFPSFFRSASLLHVFHVISWVEARSAVLQSTSTPTLFIFRSNLNEFLAWESKWAKENEREKEQKKECYVYIIHTFLQKILLINALDTDQLGNRPNDGDETTYAPSQDQVFGWSRPRPLFF